jgi:hypothetical protein
VLLAVGVGACVAIWHVLMAEPWRPRVETVRAERLTPGDRHALERVLHGAALSE